jgi:hypothetical protein
LAVEDEIVAVLSRARLHVGEIGTGVGLGESLREVVNLTACDARQEEVPLPVRPVHHQHGREHAAAEYLRGTGVGHRLAIRQLCAQRRAPPAKLLWPVHREPALLGQLLCVRMHPLFLVDVINVIRGDNHAVCVLIVVLPLLPDELCRLSAQGLLLGGKSKVHRPTPRPSRV